MQEGCLRSSSSSLRLAQLFGSLAPVPLFARFRKRLSPKILCIYVYIAHTCTCTSEFLEIQVSSLSPLPRSLSVSPCEPSLPHSLCLCLCFSLPPGDRGGIASACEIGARELISLCVCVCVCVCMLTLGVYIHVCMYKCMCVFMCARACIGMYASTYIMYMMTALRASSAEFRV